MSFPKACGLIICLLITAFLKAQESKTLLWRISGNGLAQPSYLYGTIHVKEKRVFNFGDSLYSAIQRTDGLAIEVDPKEIAAFYATFNSMKDTTGFIRQRLKPEDFQYVANIIRKKFKINPDSVTLLQFYKMQRQVRDSVLITRDEMPEFMDLLLLDYARSLEKWTGGIEDIQDQRSIPQLIQSATDLGVFRMEKGETEEVLRKLTEIYLAQDLQAIDTFWGRRNHELQRRNQKMARRIDSLMRIRTMCCLVGAAHLPGEKGVISYLRQRGFRVEPVMSSKYTPAEQVTKMLSGPIWRTFMDEDSLYTIAIPGIPKPMEGNSRNQKSFYYQEKDESGAFTSGWILNTTGVNSIEAFVDLLETRLKKKQPNLVIVRRPVAQEGRYGMELRYLDINKFWIRGRVFSVGEYFFFAIMANLNKDKLSAPFADSFLESFSINKTRATSIRDEVWTVQTDSLLGFTLQCPVALKPLDKNDSLLQSFSSIFETENGRYFGGEHLNSGTYFLVIVEKAMPGKYLIPQDIKNLTFTRNFKEAYGNRLTSESIRLGDFKGWRVHGSAGNDSPEVMGTCIYGSSHNYYLFSFSSSNWPKIIQLTERVISSFRPIPVKSMPLRSYSFDGLSARLPEAPRQKLPDTVSAEFRSWSAYDSIACVSYHMVIKPLPPFYSATSDTAFLRDYVYAKIPEDPDCRFRPVLNGQLSGWEIDRALEDSGVTRLLMRVFIHGDSIIQIFSAYGPMASNLGAIRDYLESFRLLYEVKANSVFQSQNRELLEALGSFDEDRQAEALEALNRAVPWKEDLPKAHQLLLRRYLVNSDGFTGVYRQLADWIARLEDPSSVEFVKQEFPKLGPDQEDQRAAMVGLLGKIRTSQSYAVLRQIMMERPPDPDLMTRYYQFNWSDSLELIAGLFPEILRLSADSSMLEIIAEWYLTLRQKNLARQEWLTPAIEAQYNREGERLTRKFKNIKVDHSVGWLYEARIRMLAELKAPAASILLQQLMASPTLVISLAAIKGLLRKKAQPSLAALKALATDRLYRHQLYETLQKSSKLEWMPKPYQEKGRLAESILFTSVTTENGEPDSIALLKAVDLQTDQGRFRYFLFRLVCTDDEGTRTCLGIAGKFLINAREYNPDIEGNDLWVINCNDFSDENIGLVLNETVSDWEEKRLKK